MKAEIEVLQPGLFSSIQDLGRFGYMKFGVPMSGAMDRYGATIGNIILQNPPDSSVLEITQMGPKLKISGDTTIVVSGAMLSPMINGQSIKNNIECRIKGGDIVSFGRRQCGCRAYLAIKGGFSSEIILGSRSWYDGITSHSHLLKGMRVRYEVWGENYTPNITASLKVNEDYLQQREIPIFPGPEFEFLPPNLQKKLISAGYTVDKNNNRMAIQLKELLENNMKPIVTGPVIPGTIQLTPSGKLIILMRDCQTTGGYPRVLQISEWGMNIISQKVVGEKIGLKMQE